MKHPDGGGGFRLVFDAARCDGWGMCALVFPEGVSLDPWGFAQVEPDPVTEPELQRKAIRASRCCPRQALGLSPVGSAPPPTAGARGEQQ